MEMYFYTYECVREYNFSVLIFNMHSIFLNDEICSWSHLKIIFINTSTV